MRAALVAVGFFLAAGFDLARPALDFAWEAVLEADFDLGAAGLLVEMAIKLRYHPASQAGRWASNR